MSLTKTLTCTPFTDSCPSGTIYRLRLLNRSATDLQVVSDNPLSSNHHTLRRVCLLELFGIAQKRNLKSVFSIIFLVSLIAIDLVSRCVAACFSSVMVNLL